MGYGQGHVRQVGRDRFRIVVSAGSDPISGRRRQIIETFHGSKKDAGDRAAELSRQARGGGVAKVPDLTVGQLLDRWLARAKPNLVARTAEDYEGHIRRYIKPRLETVKLAKLRPYDLDSFYEWMRTERKLSPSTIYRSHQVLSLALGQAVAWGWLARNPAALASPPTVRSGTITVPEPEQVQALLAGASHDKEWEAFLRLAVVTGARQGELCAIRASALSAEQLTICRVVEMVGNGCRVREYPKSTRGFRTMALDPAAVVMLADQIKRREKRAAEAGVEMAADPFLFSNSPDSSTPWNPKNVVGHRWARLRKAVGCSKVRFHDLRHYVATQLLAGGFDPISVAHRLGHDPRVLLARYAHWVPARDQEQAKFLGGLLAGHE